MYVKDFEPFVWEEELQILDLSYFYIGNYNIFLYTYIVYGSSESF